MKARLAGLADGRWFAQMVLEPYKLSLDVELQARAVASVDRRSGDFAEKEWNVG